jgi:ATP-dependent Lon protease
MFEEIARMAPADDDGDFLPMMSMDEEDEQQKHEVYPEIMPILPLKNTVLFPGVVIPITVGREKSIKAVQKAYETNKIIGVLSQRDSNSDDISMNNLYRVGTIARILRLLRMPDGSTTVILQGRKRMELVEMVSEEPLLQGDVRIREYVDAENKMEFDAMISTLRDKAREIVDLSPNIPNEAQVMLKNINNEVFLINFIASNMNIKPTLKQSILEIDSLVDKAEAVLTHMDGELQLLQLKSDIELKVRSEMDKQQRDYFLNQQLRTIQEELGGNPQEEELVALAERAKHKKWQPKRRSIRFCSIT